MGLGGTNNFRGVHLSQYSLKYKFWGGAKYMDRGGPLWGGVQIFRDRFIRYSSFYKARMSPALNGSSAIQRFERSNAIEICNGITFDFYTGLPHIINACACLIKYLDNEPHADLHKGRWEWSRSKCRASSQGEAKRERAILQSEA